MRNYIRYIVVLVLIIAGGLLIISVVNKFTEPDVSKINNNPVTEEKETVTDNNADVTLDVDSNQDESTVTEDPSENSTDSVNTPSSDSDTSIETTAPQETTDNVVVPNTGVKENLLIMAIGTIILSTGMIYIRKQSKN